MNEQIKIQDEFENQTSSILNYLKEGNSITPLEALSKFGCFRLGARIFDIKNYHNQNVKTEMVKEGKKRFAKYSLIPSIN